MKIKIKELNFNYPNFYLHVPELTFEKAQVASIVGPNGAGKTTLLKCLSGIFTLPPQTVWINGLDLASLKGAKRARLISYVPQELSSIFNYTVLDFVLMGRAAFLNPLSLPSQTDRKLAHEALAYIGMADYAQGSLFELSSGERRLVLIARALAQQAQILYLDEPTTFLDPKHEIEVLDLIKKLSRDKGKTIIITLHNLEMALEYSDFIVFLKQGQVVAAGEPIQILSESLLEKVYDLKIQIVDWNGKKFLVKKNI